MTTVYRVFQKGNGVTKDASRDIGDAWLPVGEFTAPTGKAAIRQAAEKLGEKAHSETFAATPVRGWVETTVSVESQPRIRLG